MKKRILAMICAVAMVVSVCAFGAQASTTSGQYKVGYSIQDINPWLNPADKSLGLIDYLGLAGRGANDIGRTITGIWDDDGDGQWYGSYILDKDGDGLYEENETVTSNDAPDPDDGLKTTCTAITDNAGQTVFFITLDTLGAWKNVTNDARAQIIKSIEENPDAWENEDGETPNVSANGITLSGSHTHSSLRLSDSMYGTYEKANPDYPEANVYYRYVIDQIVLAAQLAWSDSAPATMYKNTVDVSAVLTNEKVKDLPGMEEASNLQLNFVRHWIHRYVVTLAVQDKNGKWVSDKVALKDANGNPMIFDVVRGSNFGDRATTTIYDYVRKQCNLPADKKLAIYAYYDDVDVSFRDRWPIASKNGVDKAPADDYMHLIEFRFADSTKKPVVMLNWRAHTTENGGYYGALSSDFVGPLRTLLGKDYRVAFFLGAAGNLTINFGNSSGSNLTPWRLGDIVTETDANGNVTRKYTGSKDEAGVGIVHLYAELLKRAALTVLGGNGGRITTTGDIRITGSNVTANRKIDSPEKIRAAEELIAKYRDSSLGKDAQDNPWRKSWAPYPYLASDGETIITSYFEASNIAGRCIETLSEDGKAVTLTPRYEDGDTTTIPLTAIALGNAAAFVTAPYELSDRYYNDDAVEAGDLTDNAWAELKDIVGTGAPFVLSCTNDYISYLPSQIEYMYNTPEFTEKFDQQAEKGPTFFGSGSYESHITPFAAGAGEAMVDQFVKMLTVLKSEEKVANCKACGQENVTWTPVYNGMSIPAGANGHYYLIEDIDSGSKIAANAGYTICVDLNGHKYKSNDTALHPMREAVLNVMDNSTDKLGKVITERNSDDLSLPYGGVAVVSGNSQLNLYDGTYSYIPNGVAPKLGGTILDYGTLNLYGGTIQGADLKDAMVKESGKDDKPNTINGAAVTVSSGGELHAYGGSITDGTVNGDKERCVYVSYSTCAYTADPSANVAGVVHNKSISGLIYNGNTSVIVLKSDVVEPTTANYNATIDLNGHDITGNVTVKAGKTLYVKDSKTDDFTVRDVDGYGKITGTVSGTVKGVAATAGKLETLDYVKITEDDGISFHAVNMHLTTVGLTPASVSIRYKTTFEADEVVETRVNAQGNSYGIAFSLNNKITKLVEGTYSTYTDSFVSGSKNDADKEKVAGTKVVNIMATGNSDLTNGLNAKRTIYGAAYLNLGKDGIVFGPVAGCSLREAVVRFDSMIPSITDAVTLNDTRVMYNTFKDNMQYWGLENIPNIQPAN